MKKKFVSRFLSLILTIVIVSGVIALPSFAFSETGMDIETDTEAELIDETSEADNFDGFGFSYEEMLNNPDYFIKNENADVSIAAANSVSLNYTKLSIGENGFFTLVPTTSTTPSSKTWTSSDSTIATVNESGRVTGVRSGSATITFKAVFSNGESLSATCTVYVYLANGVYRMQNKNSSYYAEQFEGKITPGSIIKQNSIRNTGTFTDLRQMWITYFLGNGRYSIRPLYKPNMGLDRTSSGVCLSDIGYFDGLGYVKDSAEWAIVWKSTGYALQSNASSSYSLCITSSSTALYATVKAQSYSSNNNFKWNFVQVSPVPYGADLYDTTTGSRLPSAPTRSVAVGASRTLEEMGLDISIYGHASIIQKLTWLIIDGEENITVNENTGAVTGVNAGTAVIKGYRNMADGTIAYVTINICIVPFESGEYFIKNVEYSRYLQIDEATAGNNYQTSNADIEIGTYRGEDNKVWILTPLESKYYKIISAHSGLALSVGTNEVSALNIPLEQRTYTGATTQQWEFVLTSSGNYRLVPRSATGSITIASAIPANNQDPEGMSVVQSNYTNNSTYNDEWEMAQIIWMSEAELYPQQQENWCWVAAAQMFINHYFPTYDFPQSQLYCFGMGDPYDPDIDYVSNGAYNNGGTPSEIIEIIEGAQLASIDLSEGEKVIDAEDKPPYSYSSLLQFLNNCNVMVIGRDLFKKEGNQLIRVSGHCTLLSGYVKIGDSYEFIIKDPGPPNIGSIYTLSYAKLCNAFEADPTATNGYIWVYAIVLANT